MSRTSLFAATLVCVALFATAPGAKGKPEKHGRPNKPGPITCPADVPLAVAAGCPCNGTVVGDVVQPWKNHGQYVRCVAHLRNVLRKAGCLTDELKHDMVPCAAHAACGKANAPLVCCITTVAACSDPVADGVPTGTCADDPSRVCDVADDCTVTSTAAAVDEAACVAAGGVVEGAGGATCSVCSM